jgi:hypothetical protein
MGGTRSKRRCLCGIDWFDHKRLGAIHVRLEGERQILLDVYGAARVFGAHKHRHHCLLSIALHQQRKHVEGVGQERGATQGKDHVV